MIGLLLKDLYTLNRQYGKTLLFMLIFFALMSTGMDNPASFLDGFIILMSMMMSITSFSYDSLAKWDRFGLSLPVSRKDIVAGKYILSLILCFAGTILSFIVSSIVLYFKSVEGFGLTDHIMAVVGIVTITMFVFSILLPLIFKFGVEKSRILLIALFAMPTAAILTLDHLGVVMPSEETVMAIVKTAPAIVVVLYFLSFLLSVQIFQAKEI